MEKATIIMKIAVEGNQIIFNIKNSKPKTAIQTKKEHCIGLVNVKKQLELLYLNQYNLDIDNAKDFYMLNLKLEAK